MAKRIKAPKAEKVPTRGTYKRVVSAFTWGSMRDDEKAEVVRGGSLIALAPHQWDATMQEQRIASGARDNLREELRVATMKLEQLEMRLRNEQLAHTQYVESLRGELTKARNEACQLTRGMHALIDGISSPRAQLGDRQIHTLPDGRAFTMDETTQRFNKI